jgi:aspartate-semialdehyde dehydrogenase
MKKKSSRKNVMEMEGVMAAEVSLFYITFLGDAPIIKNQITFSKKSAERHYFALLDQTVNMFNSARNLREKHEASAAFLSLQVVPLRIH